MSLCCERKCNGFGIAFRMAHTRHNRIYQNELVFVLAVEGYWISNLIIVREPGFSDFFLPESMWRVNITPMRRPWRTPPGTDWWPSPAGTAAAAPADEARLWDLFIAMTPISYKRVQRQGFGSSPLQPNDSFRTVGVSLHGVQRGAGQG